MEWMRGETMVTIGLFVKIGQPDFLFLLKNYAIFAVSI